MDTNIGAKERVTQERLIGLFQNVLKYDYLGNWEYREDNALSLIHISEPTRP